MSQYNVTLKVSYDGKAVSVGTAENAADLQRLAQSTTATANAGTAAAQQNNALTTTQREVEKSATQTATAEKKLATDITQQGTASAVAAQNNTALKTTTDALAVSNTRAASSADKVSYAQNRVAASTRVAATATQNNASLTAAAATQNNVAANSYRNLAGAVSLYAAGYAGLSVVQDVSTSEQLSIRIKNLTTSFEENADVQEYLAATADRLNVRYSTLADGYGKFLALQKAGVQTTDESRSILEGLTNAAKELGASNTSVAQTIYGYSQAATQGVVQSSELLQVTEPLPGLLQNMDKAAGLAAGGFKKLTGEGKVTSAFFKQVLIKALKEYEGAAEASADTIDAAGQDFLTTYDQILVKLQTPVNAAVVPVINAAKDGLVLLGDNVDVLGNVADGATLLAAVFAGKLAGSLALTSAEYVKKTIAAQASLVADRNAAAAALAVAKAEQTATVAMYQSAVSVSTRTTLQAQASAASIRLAQATTVYTAAARAATISTRALSGAMAFLGGPVGIITTAAIAIAYFATAANDAEGPTDDLAGSVDTLTKKYKELNEQGRAIEIQKITAQETQARQNLIDLQLQYADEKKRFDDANKNRGVSNNEFLDVSAIARDGQVLTDLAQKISAAEKSLDGFAATKSALFNSTLPDLKVADANIELPTVDYTEELAKLEESLQTQEERIRASYVKRQAILDTALGSDATQKAKYNELSLQLELQRDTDLLELQRATQQKTLERAREAEEARLRNLQVAYENELAVIQGFEDRKALLQYQQDKQIADDKNQQQILYAQGFKNQSEKDEHARQEALLKANTSRTGEMQRLLFSKAEWERKNESEKAEAIIDIGEYSFKQMAGQSKKAFAMYKAFSIAKAVMNTYEMATGAFNALVNIPYVGPVLAATAAAGAVAYGLNQVQTIRAQQYTAAYHGGRDYIPEEQTALLQKGERVVSPRQNVALTAAADKINKGDVAGGTTIYYSPTITVEGGDDASFAKASQLEQQLYERFENRLVSKLRTGTGNFYRSVKAA